MLDIARHLESINDFKRDRGDERIFYDFVVRPLTGGEPISVTPIHLQVAKILAKDDQVSIREKDCTVEPVFDGERSLGAKHENILRALIRRGVIDADEPHNRELVGIYTPESLHRQLGLCPRSEMAFLGYTEWSMANIFFEDGTFGRGKFKHAKGIWLGARTLELGDILRRGTHDVPAGACKGKESLGHTVCEETHHETGLDLRLAPKDEPIHEFVGYIFVSRMDAKARARKLDLDEHGIACHNEAVAVYKTNITKARKLGIVPPDWRPRSIESPAKTTFWNLYDWATFSELIQTPTALVRGKAAAAIMVGHDLGELQGPEVDDFITKAQRGINGSVFAKLARERRGEPILLRRPGIIKSVSPSLVRAL